MDRPKLDDSIDAFTDFAKVGIYTKSLELYCDKLEKENQELKEKESETNVTLGKLLKLIEGNVLELNDSNTNIYIQHFDTGGHSEWVKFDGYFYPEEEDLKKHIENITIEDDGIYITFIE